MIKVTGRDNVEFILNAEIIEKIEEVEGSLITLTNGKKYIVTETVPEIVQKVIEYKRKIFNLGR
jgi:flagellar protein FlbD